MRRHARHDPGKGVRPLSIVVAAATLLLVLGAGTLYGTRDRFQDEADSNAPRPAEPGHTTGAPAQPTGPATTPRPDAAVGDDIAGLRAITMPALDTPAAHPPIPQGQRQQPDLYARAFVERLLRQDYTTPRQEHLAWIQSESALTDEPLVTGLVPRELRDRLALFSVTDQRSSLSPVPSPAEWERLRRQHAHTTVTVQRVTEPLAWSNAVEAGRVSDPGVTAREVTALVTLHGSNGGHATRTATSIALTINLAGPPTRGAWAFVAAITYRAVPMGSS
jgi:hypothetical protein